MLSDKDQKTTIEFEWQMSLGIQVNVIVWEMNQFQLLDALRQLIAILWKCILIENKNRRLVFDCVVAENEDSLKQKQLKCKK